MDTNYPTFTYSSSTRFYHLSKASAKLNYQHSIIKLIVNFSKVIIYLLTILTTFIDGVYYL